MSAVLEVDSGLKEFYYLSIGVVFKAISGGSDFTEKGSP
jgi:hypothetical protein